jgi:hypothetical protein
MKDGTSRREFLSFLATAVGLGVPVLAALRAEAQAGEITLTLPAKQMGERATSFKSSFVQNYFKPNAPYPIYRVLYESGLLPDDVEAERTLGRCGNIIFSSGVATLAVQPTASLVLPYHVDLAAQHLRNEVTIAKNVTIPIQMSSDESQLTFSFNPPVSIKQIDRLTLNGVVAPIPQQVDLTDVIISGSSLSYRLHSNATNLNYRIMLDFTTDSGSPKLSFLNGPRSRTPWSVASSVAACCLSLIGCINNGAFGGGSGSGQPTQYPNKEVCYNQSAPTGYVRIDSKAAGLDGCSSADPSFLNVFVYRDYIDQPSKAQFPVCADAPIPPGYIDVSGAYHDEQGCDAAKYKGTSFENSRMIYKN